jgi:hypothetical protein
MSARNTNRPSAGADRLGARLNARTHGLFTRVGSSGRPSARVQQLRDGYAADAVVREVPACLDELAEVQAHIEAIRLAWENLWQDLLESAGLVTGADPGPGLPGDHATCTSEHAADVAARSSSASRDVRLDTIARKLSSLSAYQRRAAGRRRMLVLEILRCRAQQPSDQT